MEPPNLTPLQQAVLWAQIGFYVITAISIVVTAFLGVRKYRLFRFGRPFITVNLEASSRPCSATQMQVGVTAKLYNGSRVLARADVLEWECRGLAIYDDAEIAEKITEYFISSGDIRSETGSSEFPWNIQQRIIKNDLDIQIEPNETSQDHVTFVVPRYCTAVQIRLFIQTARRARLGSMGTIYHDVNNYAVRNDVEPL